MGKRKFNNNEKFLIGFIVVLIITIALTWKDFSARIKNSLEKQKIEQTKD